ncbi:TonB-dependent receptor [Sungkyunkwania multivorans]|uniref:TonB-dependent receptor n=1 Tax=Sungkyunkwania multivorans TaxID=1173618 RepID=A0ABW3CXF7_9FLAO
MKRLTSLLILCLLAGSAFGQDQKVKTRTAPLKVFIVDKPKALTPGVNLVTTDGQLVQVNNSHCPVTTVTLCCPTISWAAKLPFTTYQISSQEFNLVTQQDIYNALRAKVPSIRIADQPLPVGRPVISMRNSVDTILLIDGVRYDLSVLNSLNPTDIESITVAPNNAALTYFLGNKN